MRPVMQMATVYFDQNVHDYCADRIDADRLKVMLSQRGHRLVIGIMDLVDAASCFKDGKPSNMERGRFLFGYLRSLLPLDFILDTDDLLRREAMKADGLHGIGSIYLTGEARDQVFTEIGKMADGVFDEKTKHFISEHWARRSRFKAGMETFHRAKSRKLARGLWDCATPFSQFVLRNRRLHDESRVEWTAKALALLFPGQPPRLRKIVAGRMLRHPERYPVLATGARISFFLNAKTARDRTFSQDLPADMSHLANAAPLDIFVTDDRRFQKAAREICRGKEIVLAEDYLAGDA